MSCGKHSDTCAHRSAVGRLIKYYGRVTTVYDCRLKLAEINAWWATQWGCNDWQSRDAIDGACKQMTIFDMAKDGIDIYGLQDKDKENCTV